MILASTMNFGEAGVTALLGYGVVFFGLILLMIVITILGKAMVASDKKKVAPVAAPEVSPVVAPKTAPGSAGGVKLYNVEPRTAAMLMAIVADKMGKPINELRFISIKEVEQ